MTGNAEEQIFLSYSRNDLEAAIALRTELEKAGLSVFQDEDSIRIGENGLNRLQETLQHCSAFILLLGRDGVQRWIGAEVNVAITRYFDPHNDSERLPIFPILLPEGDAKQLPPFLSLIQHQYWQPNETLPDSIIQDIQKRVELPNQTAIFEGCPFLGLSAFQPKHAPLFFGRHWETQQALKCFGTQREDAHPDRIPRDSQYYRWIQIEGNSGAGKSSLVNAGMLPLIEQGALWSHTGYERWKILTPMMPGEKPLLQLAEVLEHSLINDPAERKTAARYQQLSNNEKAFSLRLRDFKEDGLAFLLVVDQFEELFTFSGKSERLHFDRQLATALQDKDCPFFLISTVRIDFLEGFELLPCLSDLYNKHCNHYLLKTASQASLQEIIEQPASLAGLDVKEVRDLILHDTKDEIGALPLVENALQVLWEKRQGNKLSGILYREKGGIGGLLEDQADALLE